jgi:hypothetical protein
MTDTGSRTTQLRRYVIDEQYFDGYLEWWKNTILPLRVHFGFSIDAAFADRENHQIVWAISVAGTVDNFADVERVYFESDARRHAFVGIPDWVTSSTVGFVESYFGPPSVIESTVKKS